MYICHDIASCAEVCSSCFYAVVITPVLKLFSTQQELKLKLPDQDLRRLLGAKLQTKLPVKFPISAASVAPCSDFQ